MRAGRTDRIRAVLEIVALLLTIAVAAALLYRLYAGGGASPKAVTARAARPPAARPPAPLPTEPVSLEGAALRGSRTAPVVLIEYSDFQCPFCGMFVRDTLPALVDKYVTPGRVLLAFRHFPLRSIHPFAGKAAEAAACAGMQHRFWEMHDRLFADQKRLDAPDLLADAAAIGLDKGIFTACLDGQEVRAVHADELSAQALAVTGTPTFFVGRIQADGKVRVVDRLSGAGSSAQFEQALDRAIGTGTTGQ